jgi:hypothetical protein
MQSERRSEWRAHESSEMPVIACGVLFGKILLPRMSGSEVNSQFMVDASQQLAAPINPKRCNPQQEQAMFRSSKLPLNSLVGLVLVALAVVFAPASAMAGGKKPPKTPKTPHTPIVIHHEHHVHFHPGTHIGIGVFVGGGFGYHGTIVSSGGYVVNNPVVNPIVDPVVNPVVSPVVEPIVSPVVNPVVAPVVAPVVNPVASQAAYTLFYADSQGQTQTYGQYVATSYADGTTDWGGLIEARDQLTASGIQWWVSAGTPTTTTVGTAAATSAGAKAATTATTTATADSTASNG